MMIKTMIPTNDSKSRLSLYEFTILLPIAFLYELYKTVPYHYLLLLYKQHIALPFIAFLPSHSFETFHFPSLQKKTQLFYFLCITSNCLPFPHYSEPIHFPQLFISLPLANKIVYYCMIFLLSFHFIYIFALPIANINVCPFFFFYPLLAPSVTSSSFLLSQSPSIQW